MERSTIGDNILPCPQCLSNSELVIGWFPDPNSNDTEYTRVGCKKCNKYFSEKKGKHAVALWNYFAVTEFEKLGKELKYSKLYKLLYAQTISELEALRIQKEIDTFLKHEISTRCDFNIGDTFTDKSKNNSDWIVREIHSVYGWNTGPFWIIKAESINVHGKFTDNIIEFWEKDKKFFLKRDRYFTPTRWLQIKPKISCMYKKLIGEIISINTKVKKATLKIDGQLFVVNSLKDIKIPIEHINLA